MIFFVMFLYVCLLSLAFLFITIWWKTSKFRKLSTLLKNDFTAFPVVGHAYMLLGNSEDLMTGLRLAGQQAVKHDGVAKFWLGHLLYLVIADPEIAEFILKTSMEKDDTEKLAKMLLGNGSVIASVPIWRRRRKLCAPVFSAKNLKRFVGVFSKQSRVMVEQLRFAAGSGPFSVWDYVTTYSLDSVCETLFGVEMRSQKDHSHPFVKATHTFTVLIAKRISQPWLHNDFIYKLTPSYSKIKDAMKILTDFTHQVVQSKREEMYALRNKVDSDNPNRNPSDVKTLQDLLKNSSSKGLSDLELKEEALTLALAGTDTSATGAAFTLLMLSRHPDVQEKLYQELKVVFDDTNRPVEAEDLPHLKYLEAVIRESIRLYPPVPIIARKVDKDFMLPSGITVCEGTGIIINIWAVNRNPRYWGEDAELFRPERFLSTAFKHPAQFMSFSAGPRNCIGYKYAMLSMKTELATLLRQYRVLPASLPDSESDASAPAIPAQTAHLRVKFEIMLKDVNNFTVQFESRALKQNC